MAEIQCATNPDLPTWDINRRRNATISRDESRPTSSRVQDSPQLLGPQHSAPKAVNLISRKGISKTPVLDDSIGKPRGMHSTGYLPRLTEPYAATAEASTYHFCHEQRHNLNYGPQQPANTSPRETSTGTWRSLQHSDSACHTADAPLLTLQIPPPLDLHRSSALNTPSLQHGRTLGSNSHRPTESTASTLLPSFATLRDNTHRFENVEGSKTVSMLPLYHSRQQSAAPSVSSLNSSPPNPLKRPAEPSDREGFQGLKRLQSGVTLEQAYHSGRRGSIDQTAREPRLEHSPPPTESIPGSAHPRLSSPAFGRYSNHRTLPSPSSLAYPTPIAPALPPLSTAQHCSASSPATSSQPPSTTQTASSKSATSQHIADLQHQVTLKSLALQTLQSEYASLLQKLQRERVKSQTIEKKTNAADQEVNDLTSKNEDLIEQVKTLETQLEESERKREDQRQDAAREKEQWGRMLEMSGRLQSKADAEKQRLLEEINFLSQRLATYEDGGSQRPCEQASRDITQPAKLGTGGHGPRQGRDADLPQRGTHMAQSMSTDNSHGNTLQQEVISLRARVHALRSTLEGVRRHNEELETSTRGILEQTGLLWSNVSRALDDDESQGNRRSEDEPAGTDVASATRPQQDPNALGQTEPPQSTTSTRQPGTLEIFRDGQKPVANIAEVARAKTVEPREPSLHNPTTTSSPEELITALGQVPTTLDPFQDAAPTTSWTPLAPSGQGDQSAEPCSAPAPTMLSGYIGHHRPAESSPPSQHSSHVGGHEEGSSGSSATGRRSCSTEPEPSTMRSKSSPSVVGPLRPILGGYHSHSFHGHGKSVEWMPPPPKPEVRYAEHPSTHV